MYNSAQNKFTENNSAGEGVKKGVLRAFMKLK